MVLFTEGKIGTMTLKNRYVLAPMVRNYAAADGTVTPRYLAHVERVAQGGVGMMIMEASFVAMGGRGFINQLGIHDDAVIPGLKTLVDAAHRHGAKIGVQLFHGGRQASSAASGSQPVAPSAIPDPLINEQPREGRRDGFRRAARRARVLDRPVPFAVRQ
ncbi:MAG: hypothetical protein RLZZ324_310 [Candidatus Parcubacteria bacterium]|jgi:2,4-dienoyl-CoA reductase-like NADH-dependent reductase (Old Yellow Enzyme family)